MTSSHNYTCANALLYCRVSSDKQDKVGDGLDSQKTRSREFALSKGYVVDRVYHDKISGKTLDRPGLNLLFNRVRELKGQGHEVVVIVDDISRLARNVGIHQDLRDQFARAGVRLESPSVKFGADADSKLFENLLATVAQHGGDKNQEQTVNRMRSRIANGYACFKAPVGYKYGVKAGRGGKVLVPEEPFASIVREALVGYASGRFASQSEVQRFLEGVPDFPKTNGEVRLTRVKDILTCATYAGFVEAVPNWGLPRQIGHHEALIDRNTFRRNQEKLIAKKKAPFRKDRSRDFPLRGFVLCSLCGVPLTGAWSTGYKKKRYAHYSCRGRDCPNARKAIPKSDLEAEFKAVLQSVKPNPSLRSLAESVFREGWDRHQLETDRALLAIKRKLSEADKAVNGLVDRIVQTDIPSMIELYEGKIETLQEEKAELKRQLDCCHLNEEIFNQKLQLVQEMLTDPSALWSSGVHEVRILILRLVFSECARYSRQEGFKPVKTSAVFGNVMAVDATVN